MLHLFGLLFLAVLVGMLAFVQDQGLASVGYVLVWLFAVGVVVVISYVFARRRERRAMLLWHLALSAERGRSLAADLRTLCPEMPRRWRRRIESVASELEAGAPLSVALAGQRVLTTRWVVPALAVGEAAGRLPQTLRDLAERSMKPASPEGRSLGFSLLYVVLVLNVTLGIAGFLGFRIVPRLQRIFQGFGTELPSVTQSMIAVIETIRFSPLAAIVIAAFVAVVSTLAEGSIRGWTEVYVPFAGKWLVGVRAPALHRSLAEAVDGGLPLREAIDVAASRNREAFVRDRLENVRDTIDAGGDVWEAMAWNGFLARREIPLVRSGERVGNLAWTLRELADGRERRWSHRASAAGQFIEPFAVLAIGLFVAFLSIAFFLPLVKMINDLS